MSRKPLSSRYLTLASKDVKPFNEVSVFPRNFYSKRPVASSVSAVISPRDKMTHYTYSHEPLDGKERSIHTLRYSVFGYDRFHNEYGLGSQTRGYIEPLECSICDIPRDMAPKRFY